MAADQHHIQAVVDAVKDSRKYRDTHEGTIRALAEEALRQYKKPKQAVKAVRTRLHSIMAPYLGDPDYDASLARLTAAFHAGDQDQIRAACWDSLYGHLSTRERLPIMEEFYQRIFEVTGKPKTIMDIACGLNPMAIPWMGLDLPLDFYAYDIHQPRISYLNAYFVLQGLPPYARLQDVAMDLPQERADVALFLKEMPRFERNYKGLGRTLLDAIQARYLILSFPTISTHGGRNLTSRYRDFFYQLIDGKPWTATELLFEGEMVFCVKKELDS